MARRRPRAPWELKIILFIKNMFNSLKILRNWCGEALLQGSLGATKLGTYESRAPIAHIQVHSALCTRVWAIPYIRGRIVHSAPVYGIPQGALEKMFHGIA